MSLHGVSFEISSMYFAVSFSYTPMLLYVYSAGFANTILADAENSEYQSDFIYHGTVSYSDTSITFYYTNEAPPFDKVFIRMPLLFQKGRRQMGIMSCISLYYQGITLKILVSHEPLTVTDEIRNELLMTPEEIKELKRTNMLIIK